MESTTIALLRAKQNVANAQQAEAKLKEQSIKEATEKAFAPLLEIFNEVRHMPAKDYRWHGRRKGLIMADHVSSCGSNLTKLDFWGGDGGTHCMFYASYENGQAVLRRARKYYEGSVILNLEEAKDQLLAEIASRIVLPEDEPQPAQ